MAASGACADILSDVEGVLEARDAAAQRVAIERAGGASAMLASLRDRLQSREQSEERYGANAIERPRPVSLARVLWRAYAGDRMLMLLSACGALSIVFGGIQRVLPGGGDEGAFGLEGGAILAAILAVVAGNGVNDWMRARQFAALDVRCDSFSTVVAEAWAAHTPGVAIDAGKDCASDSDHRCGLKSRESLVSRGVSPAVSAASDRVCTAASLVVGDVVRLRPGDIVPADGILVRDGHGGVLLVDESGVTGEPDAVPKSAVDNCVDETSEEIRTSPVVVSGSRVCDGQGRLLVLAVGPRSFQGRMAAHGARPRPSMTPLQAKLNGLAEWIARAGIVAGALYFAAHLADSVLQSDLSVGRALALHALPSLIDAVALIVVIVPEGLPMAVAMALAAGTRRLLADRALVRVLSAVEVMGAATVVCTDKTGTLTLGRMSVVACSSCGGGVFSGCGGDASPDRERVCCPKRTQNADPSMGHHQCPGVQAPDERTPTAAGMYRDDDKSDNGADTLPDPQGGGAIDAHGEELEVGAAVNTSAFMDGDRGVWVGSGTEAALLAHVFGTGPAAGARVSHLRAATPSVGSVPFSSARKWMATVLPGGRVYVKGGLDVVLARCATHDGAPLHDASRTALRTAYERMSAERGVRVLALAHGTVASARAAALLRGGDLSSVGTALCLSAVLGMEDPVRPEVPAAITACRTAGIRVIIVTGDALSTALSVARSCGVADTDASLAVEGSALGDVIADGVHLAVGVRSPSGVHLDSALGLSNAPLSSQSAPLGQKNVPLGLLNAPLGTQNSPLVSSESTDGPAIPSNGGDALSRLAVVARATPFDKQRLVEALASRGHVVAATGDGANDGPALRAAHVSFSMGGPCGTAAARAASAVVLLDDSFATIARAISWGRAVVDAVQRFLQFQLAANVAALAVEGGGILVLRLAGGGGGRPIIGAVQLLWINLLLDAVAAVAYASEGPRPATLARPPMPRGAPLVTRAMLRMVIAQGLYSALAVLAVASAVRDPERRALLAFQTFVSTQLANELNCRALGDAELWPLRALGPAFACLWLCAAVCQVLIVVLLSPHTLGAGDWAVSAALGVLVLPLGAAVRLTGRVFFKDDPPSRPCDAPSLGAPSAHHSVPSAPGTDHKEFGIVNVAHGSVPIADDSGSFAGDRLRAAVGAVRVSLRLYAALRHASDTV